ncbi:hypothetical protein BDM02DRAFT_1544963 [Thelephora ganbajun]|uniref:Uncharacterized protein n=1 Tax=Thelephora ganbajun TaxID=370292 RepID=A0ACB6Z199_THEGA|nr:hypothetical protein BDM02DRAFT_1544963 [Thelephora ganbajun]
MSSRVDITHHASVSTMRHVTALGLLPQLECWVYGPQPTDHVMFLCATCPYTASAVPKSETGNGKLTIYTEFPGAEAARHRRSIRP